MVCQLPHVMNQHPWIKQGLTLTCNIHVTQLPEIENSVIIKLAVNFSLQFPSTKKLANSPLLPSIGTTDMFCLAYLPEIVPLHTKLLNYSEVICCVQLSSKFKNWVLNFLKFTKLKYKLIQVSVCMKLERTQYPISWIIIDHQFGFWPPFGLLPGSFIFLASVWSLDPQILQMPLGKLCGNVSCVDHFVIYGLL